MNERYSQRHAEIDRGWDEVIIKVNALAQFKVQILANGSPKVRVDERPTMAQIRAACRRHDELAKDALARPDGDFSDELTDHAKRCWKDWTELYVRAVEQAYADSDEAWAWKVIRESGYKIDIEAVFALSHNAMIDAKIAAKQREIADARREAHDALEQRHLSELIDEDAVTLNELEADATRRRAIAAALQGIGNAYSAAAAAQVSTTPSRRASGPQIGGASQARSCGSDYECGIGSQCVKANFSAQGTCLRSVDSSGVQQFTFPRPESVGPKIPSGRDCTRVGCPGGFQCDMASGVCVR